MHAATPPRAARGAYERHPSDAVHLGLAALLVLVGWFLTTVGSDGVRDFDHRVVEFVGSAPEKVARVGVEAVQLVALVLPLVAIALLLYLRRFRALGYAVLAAAVTAAIAHFTVEAFEGDAPFDYVEQLRKEGVVTGYAFPDTVYLAGAVAALTALSPYMNRSWRRLSWSVFGFAVLVRILTGTTLGSDLVFTLALGWAVGSLVLLAFGSPTWTPSVAEIEAAMTRAGFGLATLAPASVDARGSVPWFGRAAAGREVFVKVEGRDQRTSDLVFRLYRFVVAKNLDDQRPFASLRRAIEHEGFVSLAASNVGVRTPPFLTVASVGNGEDTFLLAYERIAGSSLDSVEPDRLTDDVLRALWQQIAILRAHRIAHRDLRFANVFLDDDGTPWIIDFGFSELAATDRLLGMDVAQLLTACTLAVGVERAVATADEVLGHDALAQALPLLQPAGLPSATRRLLAHHKALLTDLQQEVQRVAAVDEVHLEQLERVRLRTVLMVGALGAAIYFFYPQFADLGSTMEHIPDASPGWVLVAVVCSVLTYVGATVSRLGTVPERLPPVPTFLAQVGSSFANRITPASAGGYAVNIRFLQRQGVDPAVAVTSVGINSVGGALVHIPLMLVFVAWAGQKGTGRVHVPSTRIFVLIALGLVLASAVIIAIPVTRRLVFGKGMQVLRDARHGLAEVARRPSKLILLLTGAFIVVFTYILALAASVQAYGGGLSFVAIAAAFLTGSVVGSAAPTPGGLGGVEAALYAALTVAGLDKSTALSSVFTYRLVTFWLPIIPGWIALRILRSRGDV